MAKRQVLWVQEVFSSLKMSIWRSRLSNTAVWAGPNRIQWVNIGDKLRSQDKAPNECAYSQTPKHSKAPEGMHGIETAAHRIAGTVWISRITRRFVYLVEKKNKLRVCLMDES